MDLEFSIEGDSEGYVQFECPYCESEFRLMAGEIQNEEEYYHEIFCPYCGLADEVSNFYTREAIEHAKELAMNYMYEELNKAFGGIAKKMNKSKLIKMKWKPLKKINVQEMRTEDSVEDEFECTSCNKHVKVLYCAGKSNVFCSYCGVDI
ncbi:hypothetical protein [Anoxynatronum buryatiense]|uniref:Uncharacterized protein n=1 Tax=Anoxynatronum buryatiense TaxID=489973 RepID=A0AA46AJX2_9CLOT|nr:hypothetical protein [Anoxynatronum buryatiense]SMP64270.1 hypothetical protein SAMN06296020_111121 [Anoxynatronum buryatiense]